MAKRLLWPGAFALLRTDTRAPVLFLRPFASDVPSASPSLEDVGWRVADFAGALAEKLSRTEEERLVRALSRIGPVLAIGRPGEREAPWGAARAYVKARADWKLVVASLMERCALLVLVPGDTAGVGWEARSAEGSTRPVLVLSRSTGPSRSPEVPLNDKPVPPAAVSAMLSLPADGGRRTSAYPSGAGCGAVDPDALVSWSASTAKLEARSKPAPAPVSYYRVVAIGGVVLAILALPWMWPRVASWLGLAQRTEPADGAFDPGR